MRRADRGADREAEARAAACARPGPACYGLGLFIDEDPELGRVVSHSGGYPGFGTNMRWHPATGIGVIALGNGTYAPMSVLAGQLLRALVRPSPSCHVALAPAGQPWPATLVARAAADELLRNWDDAAADALFTPNVAWDPPYPVRRRVIEQVRSRIGPLRASSARAPESDTPAHCRWWLAGERGTVQAQIQLSPEDPPRVQSLSVAVPPAAGSALERVVASLVTWLNSCAASWPESIPVAPDADVTLLTRRLRMAGAWAGTIRPGAFRAGDGSATVSVELQGEHATVVLSVAVSAETGELRQADVTL